MDQFVQWQQQNPGISILEEKNYYLRLWFEQTSIQTAALVTKIPALCLKTYCKQ